MNDLISREALDIFFNREIDLYENCPDKYDAAIELKGSSHLIPAADVRPVVRGRWIKYAPHNSDMMTCSECEKYWILDGDQYDYHYCPNCGADMREEDDGT